MIDFIADAIGYILMALSPFIGVILTVQFMILVEKISK